MWLEGSGHGWTRGVWLEWSGPRIDRGGGGWLEWSGPWMDQGAWLEGLVGHGWSSVGVARGVWAMDGPGGVARGVGWPWMDQGA